MIMSSFLLNKLQVSYRPTLISERKGLWSEKSKINSDHERKRNEVSRRKLYLNTKVKAVLHEEDTTKQAGVNVGLGIHNYFQAKNIFVTGATGLLGKVLVEKILRSTPVGKIYVLVRADDSDAAVDRLAKEVTSSEVFRCLQDKHGKDYPAFMKEKLIPVVGNICEPFLGMDSHSARTIMEDVNVIIESAAITTLNERYDLLLNANVKSTERLMSFAKTCKNLELLVHISTAYVNGEREGLILENATMKGCSPSLYLPGLDIDEEIKLALKPTTAATNYDMTKDMKRLGMERSKCYGWFNAYHMTKAMSEMVISDTRGDIPVLVIRPSVIESCYKHPSPGWIQGNRMFDPFIISYGKGQLPAFLGNPDTLMDVIPLDMVVNATIAAIAKHGKKPDVINVYQLASSVVNPLRFSDFFEYLYEYFISDPLIESESFTRITYYDNLNKIMYFQNYNEFSKYTREEMSRRLGIAADKLGFGVGNNEMKLENQCKAVVTYAQRLAKMYQNLGFFKARFDAGNMQKLLSEMSQEEQVEFEIDVREIKWKKYFQEIHIPGLRKHVLNDKRI